MERIDVSLSVRDDETIMWRGRPDPKGYFLKFLWDPLFAASILWISMIGFAAFAIRSTTKQDGEEAPLTTLIIVFVFFLMPVIIYYLSILVKVLNAGSTEYIVTDKAVYVPPGFLDQSSPRKPFSDSYRIELKRNYFDKKYNTGDIVFTDVIPGSTKKYVLSSIEDYQDVYNLIKEIQRKYEGTRIDPRKTEDSNGVHVRFYDDHNF